MREERHPSLSALTTLGLGGRAELLLRLEDLDDLPVMDARLRELGLTPLVLGRGSNLLALDGDLPLVVVSPSLPATCEVVDGAAEGQVLVRASASLPLPALLAFCARQGLSGLEGLAGIPGTVGGAVAMNAGSFGTEICARLVRLTLWQEGVRVLEASQVHASYRTLAFEGMGPFFVVLEAVFTLTPGRGEEVRAALSATLARKKAVQPIALKSAGCVFANPPEGPSAGKLLEAAGFRGRRHGGVGFSSLHANFLVHYEKGTATEALELLTLAREAVVRTSGIVLAPEVRIVPWTPL